MITLNPEFITKKGKKEFAVLPYNQYLTLQEFLEDAEDILLLRSTKKDERNKQTMSISDIKKKMKLK